MQPFVGQYVSEVSGNTKQAKETLKRRSLERIDTWGKNLFLTFKSKRRGTDVITIRTHFLMFGSYRINDPRPDRTPRLELKFSNGIVDFYSCSIRFDETAHWQDLDRHVDLMSDVWDFGRVVELMEQRREFWLCDLLLDQNVFAGSGNIIKNEVLFNVRLHPLTRLRQVDGRDWPKLAQAVHDYSWNFYDWKKKFELRKHWQVYSRSTCPICQEKLVRQKLGRFQRRTFYCQVHQVRPSRRKRLIVHEVLPMRDSASAETRLVDH